MSDIRNTVAFALNKTEAMKGHLFSERVDVVENAVNAWIAEYEKANVAYVDANTSLLDRIAALEAENEELRQSIKAAWVLGRKAWCPATILDDQERTERDWQQALAALEAKP